MNLSEGSVTALRRFNERRVLAALADSPAGLSRTELAHRLGVTTTAISGIVGPWVGKILVEDAPAPQPGPRGTPGPPPKTLRIDGRVGLALGLEFSRTRARTILVSLHGEVLDEAPELDKVHVAENDQKALDWAAEKAQLLLERHADREGEPLEAVVGKLVGIGVSLAGPVNRQAGMLEGGFRGKTVMPRWDGTRIRKELQQRLIDWSPPIVVENDATAGCYAERLYGVARGRGDFAWVKWSDSVGVGLWLNGRLYRGAGDGAGELGHLPIATEADSRDRNRDPCPHCQQYCVERMAGAGAILRYASKRYSEPLEIPMMLDQLLKEAREGRGSRARDALRLAAEYLAEGLTALVNILNPDAIVLAGAVHQPAYRHVNPGIQDVLQERAMTSLYRDVEVIAGHSDLYGKAAVRGAAAIVLAEELTPYLLRVAALPGRPTRRRGPAGKARRVRAA